MTELQQFDAGRVDDILAALESDGACVARNVLPEALCTNLLDDFAPHLDALALGEDELGYRDDFYGEKTKRLHGLFSKSERMVEVLTHPLFLALGQRMFVDTGCSSDIRLSNAELMVLHKNQEIQALHTDGASWKLAQAMVDDEILVSANCALTDFTETNGATRVVPGSHRWEPGRVPREEEICLATMPRGSALIYTGNAMHSGGANREAEARTGLYLGYIVSWLRPIENHLVTNSPGDVFDLPVSAQRLLDVVPGGFAPLA